MTIAKSDIRDLLIRCRNSTRNTALTFFGPLDEANPNECHISKPFDNGHDLIFACLDTPQWDPSSLERGLKQAKTVIAAPRGVGKTTIVSLPFIFRHIAFGLARYVVYIGASQHAAIEQTETLKQELVENALIREVFGNLKTETFSQERWDVVVGRTEDGRYSHRTRVLPIGPGGKIRGRKAGYSRPDLIILDDVEFDEEVESEEQRVKLSQWLNTAVLNSVDMRRSWHVVMIGTILHHDSLLANLLDDKKSPEWHGVKLSICTPDYQTLWPNVMSSAQVQAKVQTFRDKGRLSQFSREFMNEPVPDEEQAFKPEFFQHYDEGDLDLNNDRDVISVVSIDPARSLSAGSARTAIVGIGVNCTTHQIYIRDLVSAHLNPDQLYDAAFSMADRLNARGLIVEVTGLLEYIRQPIENRMRLHGTVPLYMIEIKPRDRKEKRAGALIPYYRTGKIWHNRSCCTLLEDRLQEWPCCSAWDEIDATSQIIPAMEQEELWFFPPDREDPEEVYNQLLEEDREEEAFEAWQFT